MAIQGGRPVLTGELQSFFENPHIFDSSPAVSPLLFTFVDADRNTPLLLSIKGGWEAAFGVLLSAGLHLDQQNIKGITPLALASQKGRENMVLELLRKGASVDHPNLNGSTALIQASHFGHCAVVDALISFNARIDTRNSKRTTALMRACQEGHFQVVVKLLAHRCDVNARNDDGMNSLMLGSQRGHAQIVKLLIDNGATIDGKTVQGSTALMLACKRGHIEVVRVLLSAGAELHVKDSKGRIARDQASRRGQEKILELLSPQSQMRLMQSVSRSKRSKLLRKLFYLVQDSRATILERFVQGSGSLRALARVLGIGSGGAIDVRPIPYGVFEMICDYLPLPRLWCFDLERFDRRIRNELCDAAIHGALTVMDEIFFDYFKPRPRAGQRPQHHEGWMVKVASDPALQLALSSGPLRLPDSTLSSILQEYDLQRILMRHGQCISCAPSVAENIMQILKQVHAWYLWQDSPGMYSDPRDLATFAQATTSIPHQYEQTHDHTSGFESDSDESDM